MFVRGEAVPYWRRPTGRKVTVVESLCSSSKSTLNSVTAWAATAEGKRTTVALEQPVQATAHAIVIERTDLAGRKP